MFRLQRQEYGICEPKNEFFLSQKENATENPREDSYLDLEIFLFRKKEF